MPRGQPGGQRACAQGRRAKRKLSHGRVLFSAAGRTRRRVNIGRHEQHSAVDGRTALSRDDFLAVKLQGVDRLFVLVAVLGEQGILLAHGLRLTSSDGENSGRPGRKSRRQTATDGDETLLVCAPPRCAPPSDGPSTGLRAGIRCHGRDDRARNRAVASSACSAARARTSAAGLRHLQLDTRVLQLEEPHRCISAAVETSRR